jgi:hypothetical protein
MCKELIPQIKFACSHVLDKPADLVEWEGCGGCGIKRAGPEYLGGTTKREPCEDRKQPGRGWVQNEQTGRWSRIVGTSGAGSG